MRKIVHQPHGTQGVIGRVFIAAQASQGSRQTFVGQGVVAVDLERTLIGPIRFFIAAHPKIGLTQLQMQSRQPRLRLFGFAKIFERFVEIAIHHFKSTQQHGQTEQPFCKIIDTCVIFSDITHAGAKIIHRRRNS